MEAVIRWLSTWLGLSPIAIGALFILTLVMLWLAILAAVAIIRDRQDRKRFREAITHCLRCGKPIATGAEEYHRQRCTGRREQQNFRWRGGGHVER